MSTVLLLAIIIGCTLFIVGMYMAIRLLTKMREEERIHSTIISSSHFTLMDNYSPELSSIVFTLKRESVIEKRKDKKPLLFNEMNDELVLESCGNYEPYKDY